MFPEAPSSERITVADTLAGAAMSAINAVLEIFSVWKKLVLSAFGNVILVPLPLTAGVVSSWTTFLVSLLLQPAIMAIKRQLQTSMFFMVTERFD
jgi:hypothetical protein